MRLKGISVLIFTLLSTCTFNNHYINREEDRDEALKVTSEFYRLIRIKEFDRTVGLFSDEFLKATNKKQLISLLNKFNFVLGDLKNVELHDWKTEVLIGTNSQSNYFLVFKNQYESFPATETIKLSKKSGEIKITSYDVRSFAFKIPMINNPH